MLSLFLVVLSVIPVSDTMGGYVLGWTDAGGEHSTQKVPKGVL
jgi:hypothetical protein